MPSDAARLGLEFLSAKMPHASPKVIMDFLRNMNKVLGLCVLCCDVRCDVM